LGLRYVDMRNKFNIPIIKNPNYSLVDNYIEHWRFGNGRYYDKIRYINDYVIGIMIQIIYE
jgi:hypothetical protein